jgi:hypothetical protein
MQKEEPLLGFDLSSTALHELQGIAREEYPGENFTMEEIKDMALRLLRLYLLLFEPPAHKRGSAPVPAVLTEQESRALAFLSNAFAKGQRPSVRHVAKALGYRSARTGFRLVEQLIAKGMVQRLNGRIQLRKQV